MSNLERAFRQLREAWYNEHIKSYAHEREYEDEESTELRELQNEESKAMFDAQTEFIIENEYYDELDARLVYPSCGYDMSYAKELYGCPKCN